MVEESAKMAIVVPDVEDFSRMSASIIDALDLECISSQVVSLGDLARGEVSLDGFDGALFMDSSAPESKAWAKKGLAQGIASMAFRFGIRTMPDEDLAAFMSEGYVYATDLFHLFGSAQSMAERTRSAQVLRLALMEKSELDKASGPPVAARPRAGL